MDMGEGVEVGKVCGPKVMPLDPLPVREVEQLLPPPGVCRRRWVRVIPPRVPIFLEIPLYGGWCVWAADQILPGVTP